MDHAQDMSTPSFSKAAAFLHSRVCLPLVLGLLTLGIFGDVLFSRRDLVLSSKDNDVAQQFYYYRAFGFSQLRAGHLILWNPHLYSGVPFMGTWQSGLLYPPNWIYLVLPLDAAINWEIAISVFLAGLGTALWARYHGMHPIAALLAGVMVMFGGPFFLHVYAGHLSALDAMAWVPYMLLATDGLFSFPEGLKILPFRYGSRQDSGSPLPPFPWRGEGQGERGSADSSPSRFGRGREERAGVGSPDWRALLRWALLLTFSFAMALLAGHPQSVFNAIVTLVVYVAVRLAREPKSWPAAFLIAAAGVGGALIAAAQIVTGLAAASETTRGGGVPYSFAALFSFPPDNFLTALAPDFFGNMADVPYWGGAFLWEMCLFEGVCGLALALYGVARGTSRRRGPWGAMVAILMLIALGSNTPLLHFLYLHVPGFNRFRSESKFIYEVGIFVAMLAAAGLDALLQGRVSKAFTVVTAAAGAGLIVVGLLLATTMFGTDDDSIWQHAVQQNWPHPNYPPTYNDPGFFGQSQTFAGMSCMIAGCVAVLLASLLAASRNRRAVYAIAVLGICELVVFARTHTATFAPSVTQAPQMQQVIAADPGDYRVLQFTPYSLDVVMSTHSSDLWGYDPSVLERYVDFMAFAEGTRRSQGPEDIHFSRFNKFLSLFRLKYVFTDTGNGGMATQTLNAGLPHGLLINNVDVIADRDRILAAMNAPEFDVAKTAVVEAPLTQPVSLDARGHIQVTEDYPGRLTIRADVTGGGALALITDPYSRDWHATPQPGSSQQTYQVVPTDWAAMAIPLNPGHHVIRLEYRPSAFTAACWVSGIATALFGVLLAIAFLPSRRLSTAPPTAQDRQGADPV